MPSSFRTWRIQASALTIARGGLRELPWLLLASWLWSISYEYVTASYPRFHFCFLTQLQLHFIMAISHYHQHLYRFAPTRTMSMGSHSRTHSRKLSQDQHLQRVYLLPRDNSLPPDGTVLVYAPVPLSELSPEVAQNLKKTATEAWFRQDSTASSSSPSTTRSRAQSNAYKNRLYETGRISLPIRQGEGLLEGDKDS